MGRNRDKSELAHLKGIIRKLESENKQLKRQAKRVQKEQARLDVWMDDVMDAYVEEVPPPPPPNRCPSCGDKTNYVKADLGNRILHNCKNCGYRKSEKTAK